MEAKETIGTVEFEQVVERGCGIDIHKKVLVVTIQGKGLKEETRSFNSFTEDIESLRSWLLDNSITHVAMPYREVDRTSLFYAENGITFNKG